MRCTPIIIAIALALISAPSAEAASKGDRAKAKKLTKTARAHFAAKEFRDARNAYQRAFDLVPLPALRFNIGQCDLALKRYESAITEFKAFLDATPDTPYAEDVNKLITDAKAELAKRAPPPPRPPKSAPPPPPPTEAAPPPPVAPPLPQATPPPQVAPELTTPIVDEETGVLQTWWFWTIVSVAAIAAGGTAIALSSGGERTVLPMGDLGLIDRRGGAL